MSVWRTWFATRGPTIASSADGGIGIPSRSAASSVSSNVLPLSSACIRTVDWRVSIRLTTNAGASFTSTPRLPSFRVTSQAVASVTSSVAGVADDLDEGQHRDGVEEVEADDPLGVLEALAHRGDRERGRVRHEQALGGDDRLERAEDLALEVELLEHRLEDEVAAGVRLDPRARGDDRAEEARLALAEASLRDEAGQLAPDRLDRPLDPLGVDVGQHDGHLEAAEEERRELGCHQAGADDADALDPPRRRLRDPRGPLDPPLDHVEGVDRRLRLGTRQQLGQRLGLGGIALLERPRRRALDQLERPVRRGRLAVDGVVDPGARLPHDVRDVGEIGRRLALPLARLDPAEEELERLVDELDRVEHVVDEPELERVRGAGSGGSA